MNTKLFDFTEENGLVFCDKIKSAKNNAELLYLYEAKKIGVSAVFFRRYYREGESIPYTSEPAVCIFEREDNFFNTDEHIRLHAALWSSGRTEIYVIISKLRINVINVRKPAHVNRDKTIDLQELILVSAEAVKALDDARFSAYLFESGTFWEQEEFQTKVDVKNSPYIYLLEYLMSVRDTFVENERDIKLRPDTIDKLLVTSILIKFLEEIKDDNGKHTLRTIYKRHKVKSFDEAVSNGLVFSVLDELAGEFNGRIFDRFTQSERNDISKSDLSILTKFLRADIDINTNQLFLWEQYSFKHLPAEVISAIYENFIQAEAVRQSGINEKGVVYTPVHLVNLLIDETMPLDKPELFKDESFRVLDPACGSGVFLVAAYKRMLQWWAINNYDASKGVKYPQNKEAQRILEQNIFGIDVKETATFVSIFGLTTALLDKLTPQAIWNNFRFKDLSLENIISNNFFTEAIRLKSDKKFNLIVGNPPFNIENGKKRTDVISSSMIDQIGFKHKNLPNNNFALHFFEAALTISNKVCLILPANVLLYNKSAQDYRAQIFTDFSIQKLFDFTHLRRELFHKTADTPVIAIVALNDPSNHKPIEHIVVKRLLATEKKLRFDFDYYDYHKVNWSWATDPSKSFIWKTNLLGGGRLFHLINKLSQLRSLTQFISEMKRLHPGEWEYSIGYKVKNIRREPQRNVDFIFGKPSIITDSFDETESFETFIETNKDYAEPRARQIYEPPHVIIKANTGTSNIPIHFSEKYLCFKDKLIGLHASKKHKHLLKEIYNRFKDEEYAKLYRLWVFCTSAETLVNLETACKKEDIDTLPYPTDLSYLRLNKQEKALRDDVLNYYIHLGKAIGENGAGNVFIEKANPAQLKSFGRHFNNVMNDLYATKNKSWQVGTIVNSSNVTAYVFCYGKTGDISESVTSEFAKTTQLIISEKLVNNTAVCKRIVRIYKHIDGYDCVVFIKPNLKKYWLNSVAIRDADDTIHELKKAGF